MFNKDILFWKLVTAASFIICITLAGIALNLGNLQLVLHLERKALKVTEWQIEGQYLKMLTDDKKCRFSYKFTGAERLTVESITKLPLPNNVTILYPTEGYMSASNVQLVEVDNTPAESIILSNTQRKASTNLYEFAAVLTFILTMTSAGMLKVCIWLNRIEAQQ